MSFESELFTRLRPDFSRFPAAGFVKENGTWRTELELMNGQFRAVVTVNEAGEVSGRVYDADTEDEYLAVHIPSQSGAFVASVREAYAAALNELAKKCFIAHDFAFDQANRVAQSFRDRWGEEVEFLWPDNPDCGAVRCASTGKWYAAILSVERGKVTGESGRTDTVEIIDIKASPADVPALLEEPGIYPAWHMNKKHWITVILDGTVSNARLFELTAQSRALVAPDASLAEHAWIVPANYGYWDVEKNFDENPVHTWKQTARVQKGDLAFLYISEPVAAVWCKCRVLETDIPFEYGDENVTMKKVMRLEMISRYGRELLPKELLKRFGVTSVRSTRRIPAALLAEIERLEQQNRPAGDDVLRRTETAKTAQDVPHRTKKSKPAAPRRKKRP